MLAFIWSKWIARGIKWDFKKYLNSVQNCQFPISLVGWCLVKAGLCHSLLPFINLILFSEQCNILTASLTCLSNGFLKVFILWNSKAEVSPTLSLWQISRCFANAFLVLRFRMSSSCSENLCLAEDPDSPQYSVIYPWLYKVFVFLMFLERFT